MATVVNLCEEIDNIWDENFSDISKMPNIHCAPTTNSLYAELADIIKINTIFDIIISNHGYNYKSMKQLYGEFNEQYTKEYANFSDKILKWFFKDKSQELVYTDDNNKKHIVLVFKAYDFLIRKGISPATNYFIHTASPLFFTTIIKRWKDIEQMYTSSESLQKFYDFITKDSMLYYPLTDTKSLWHKISYWYLMERHFAVGLYMKITDAVIKYLNDDTEKALERQLPYGTEYTYLLRNKTVAEKRLKYFVSYLRTIPSLIVLGRDEIIDILYKEFISGTGLYSIVSFLGYIPEIMTEFRRKMEYCKDFSSDECCSEELFYGILEHYLEITNIKNKAKFMDKTDNFNEYDNINKYFSNPRIKVDSSGIDYNIWNCHLHI